MTEQSTIHSSTVTFDNVSSPPPVLQITLRNKSMWDKFVEKCEGMSPASQLQVFNSEKFRILAEVTKRGRITQEEADFLNKAIRRKSMLRKFWIS